MEVNPYTEQVIEGLSELNDFITRALEMSKPVVTFEAAVKAGIEGGYELPTTIGLIGPDKNNREEVKS